MKIINTVLLLIVSFSIFASETKSELKDNKQEGITIISEEHVRTSGVSSVAPVEMEVKKLP
jgi:hypothetical protein